MPAEAAADEPATLPVAPVDEGAAEAGTGTRKDRIGARLASILGDLSGVDVSALDPTASFADLGFDSLFLTQANSQFRKQFGVRITFRQLFEEAPSIDFACRFHRLQAAEDAFPEPDRRTMTREPAAATASDSGRDGDAAGEAARSGAEREPSTPVDWLIREQLRIMEQQLELMRSGSASRAAPGRRAGAPEPAVRSTVPTTWPTSRPAAIARRSRVAALTERQQAAIDDLVRRYNARTPGSKRLAQLWRPRLADNRAIVGFDQAWKELVYQIVSERSSGSRIWDVDGNEYIDTALGFGTNLFGHSPDFVVAAVREQLGSGLRGGRPERRCWAKSAR